MRARTSQMLLQLMNVPGTITSFRGKTDLAQIRDIIFKNLDDAGVLACAVARVAMWQTRGRLPHAIDATIWIISARIADPMFQDKSKPQGRGDSSFVKESSNANQLLLRHAYSMALVRFVNGMLDPYQSGQFAMALSALARDVGLPYLFVEIRHWATHEHLPSLALLRETSLRALDWLHDNYWGKLDDRFPREKTRVDNLPRIQKYKETISFHLRSYDKKYRKRGSNYVPVNASIGVETEAVDYLSTISANKNLNFFLAKLLAAKMKLSRENGNFKMQASLDHLLESLHAGTLMNSILWLIHQSRQVTSSTHKEISEAHLSHWLKTLIPMIFRGPFPVSIHQHIYCSKHELATSLTNFSVLLRCTDLMNQSLGGAKDIGTRTKNFESAPSLDDILSGVEFKPPSNTSTKTKRELLFATGEAKRQKKSSLFKKVSTWHSRPFGTQ